MKKVDLFLLILCGLFSFTPLSGQTTDHVLGELLVQLKPSEDAHRWVRHWSEFAGRPTGLRLKDHTSEPLNIWLLQFDHGNVHELRLLSSIRRDPAVVEAQFNHFVNLRSTVPDDPSFNEQWQYINTGQNGGLENADLDIDLVWDITTGGVTVDGDTIVVCVIDDGINLDHEDLAGNLWINREEIPDNGVDDDLNGYVDDYQGWNVLQDNDNIESGGVHGTPVSGIIGAAGNNGLGVSGVNWDVKIMMVKNNFNTTEASVIEAYSYPLIQRMRYNASQGEEGAFVVATNASWGLDDTFPDASPLWCGLYDSLGVHGILSCGATNNSNVNVDEVGDLPTTCPSDYLLSVTNINRNDEKVQEAGFGPLNIDLGAYGQETYTLTRTGYGNFRGTSSATPHVTGTIALLYSAPCPSLMAVAKSDPAGAALLVRQYILEGVTPNESLDTITVTGGRLNVFNSMLNLINNCQDCQPPTSIRARDITDVSAGITWIVNDSISRVDLRYRISGATAWTEVQEATSPYPLIDLLACTNYEFQIKTYCEDEVRDYDASRFFKTDGCCEAPEPILVSDITENAAEISWPPVLAAGQYILRWRNQGVETWEEVTTILETVPLAGLTSCAVYEYQLVVNCSDGQSVESPVYSFSTTGCGFCRDSEYCSPGVYDSEGEWISRVYIGALDNESGNDGGFGEFTSLESPLLVQGGIYDILLKPGFSAQAFSEYFLVWIDLDQDGVFSSEEVVYDPGKTTKDSLIGQLSIPADALTGNTRMRVAMRFQQPSGPCSQFGSNVFGEVEDYCVEILQAPDCELPTGFDTLAVNGEEVSLTWMAPEDVSSFNVRYRPLNTLDWNTLSVSDTFMVISGLSPCTAHEAQIQSDCGASQSVFLGNLLFDTDCVDAVHEPEVVRAWQVFPNPFQDQLTVTWDLSLLPINRLRVQVLSPSGQVILTREQPGATGKHQLILPTQDLPPGLYLIRLTDGNRPLAIDKLIKMK